MVKVPSNLLMEIIIKVNGKTTVLMEKELFIFPTTLATQVLGITINNKVLGFNSGAATKATVGSGVREGNMEREN
jgi:hypothetical protein